MHFIIEFQFTPKYLTFQLFKLSVCIYVILMYYKKRPGIINVFYTKNNAFQHQIYQPFRWSVSGRKLRKCFQCFLLSFLFSIKCDLALLLISDSFCFCFTEDRCIMQIIKYLNIIDFKLTHLLFCFYLETCSVYLPILYSHPRVSQSTSSSIVYSHIV